MNEETLKEKAQLLGISDEKEVVLVGPNSTIGELAAAIEVEILHFGKQILSARILATEIKIAIKKTHEEIRQEVLAHPKDFLEFKRLEKRFS